MYSFGRVVSGVVQMVYDSRFRVWGLRLLVLDVGCSDQVEVSRV